MSSPDTSSPAAALPLISVIVRSMDRPSLAAALASIAAQDASPVEVVLVNALGPAHGPVPTAAGAHPLHRIDAGRPLPRSAAANAGLDAAQGRWVIFLDDDDVYLPGHLSRLAAALAARPAAVAAYADVDYGRDGADGWVSEHVFAADFDPLRLRFENFLPLHAVLVDRGSEARRACRFDESLDLFEDWDWWLQLARLGPFVRVPGISARYVAAAAGGSGVFVDNDSAARARERLLLKWLHLDAPGDRLALMRALQAEYRAAHQAADQLALARQTAQNLRDMLAAREREIGDALAQIESLHAVIAARDHEIRESATQIDDLHAVIAAREREISDSRAYGDGLRQVLAARDEEIVNLRDALSRRPPP
jgi:hypothetical protein